MLPRKKPLLPRLPPQAKSLLQLPTQFPQKLLKSRFCRASVTSIFDPCSGFRETPATEAPAAEAATEAPKEESKPAADDKVSSLFADDKIFVMLILSS